MQSPPGRLGLYVDRLRALHPALPLTTTEWVEMGQNNDVLIVNESLIFRFPRYRQGDRRVATRSVPVIGHRAEQRVAHSSAHLYVPELGDARRGVHSGVTWCPTLTSALCGPFFGGPTASSRFGRGIPPPITGSAVGRPHRMWPGDGRAPTALGAAVWPHHGAPLPRLVTTRAAAEIIAPLGIARANYAKLIATWAQWEGVSRQAQG